MFPKYDDPALEAAGLVIAGDAGKRYDRFRDRIMFPIHDSRGRVIGFGGRVLGAGEPKYLNSPETPVFSKGRELYGLYLARNALRDAGRVVVVEGYMDVVALAQHGVEYAVATLGTSTTPVHAQKLFRLTDAVVFCFDGDNAGRKAAWRALENTLPEIADGKNATFLFLPDGEDPDDFVRKRGKAAFETALANAMPLSEFLLSELAARHPPTTSEGRAALVAAARPLLAQIAAPVLSAILRKRLAELSGLPEEDLRGLLAATGPREAPAPESPIRATNVARHARAPAPRMPVRRPPSLTRQLIQGLLLRPGLARSLAFPPPDESTPEAAALTALVAFCAEAEGPLTTAAVMAGIRRHAARGSLCRRCWPRPATSGWTRPRSRRRSATASTAGGSRRAARGCPHPRGRRGAGGGSPPAAARLRPPSRGRARGLRRAGGDGHPCPSRGPP